GYGSFCSEESPCTGFTGASCLEDTCKCEDGQRLDTYGRSCISNGYLGACEADSNCTGFAGAKCLDGKCRCSDGLRIDSYGRRCIKLYEVGHPCDVASDHICGKYAHCNETCVCNENYKVKYDQFNCKAELDQICSEDSDCYDKYAKCTLTADRKLKCQCDVEHPLRDGNCSDGSIASLAVSAVLLLLVAEFTKC
ncbi:hypothetical protein J437_LFUL009621, partial [Ladona fulva]